MKPATTLPTALILLFSLASANPHHIRDPGSGADWAPGGPNDFRGPCPMMNTLANHGFLPHDGKNLTQDIVVNALQEGLNFDPALGTIMFRQALVANPEPNATWFDLDQLNRHNVLEHDASISREDAFFGNNHVFNQTIFDTTKLFWTEETLDANMLANGKLMRQLVSKAFNPTYTFTEKTEPFSLGEMAAPIIVFGDLATSTVKRTQVVYFIENERLPTDLGWVKKTKAVNLDDISKISATIENALSLLTNSSSDPSAPAATTRDLHGPIAVRF